MNLHEIVADTLALLHLGTEASTTSAYTPEFRKFANDAIIEISRRFRQTRTEIVELDNNFEFPLTDLDRMCLLVVSVQDMHGRPLQWKQTAIGTGVIHVYLPIAVRTTDDPKEKVRVLYQFRPARLVNPEDIPELPDFCHDCIPYFIAAQHHLSQGGDNTGMGSFFLSEFQRMLNDLPYPYYGDEASKRIHNYNKGLI